VVGAGGGGFPAAVKLSGRAPTLLVNAAECEPLLHKDKELLVHCREEFFAGLREAMERIGASAGIIGIKEKYGGLIGSLEGELPPKVSIHPLPDVYPAGDEFVLVHEVTGKAIPPGGLPRDVGVVVCNVETLVNIGIGRPVTDKFLTVAGAVRRPATLRVPVGVSFGECMDAAGGAAVKGFGVLSGGAMMGTLVRDLAAPVTKTTGAIVVLPEGHPVLVRYRSSDGQARATGKAACDQCTFCTELCPRYLLGHPIQPHRAMRALGFETAGETTVEGVQFCCECNLCTMYSCPENLDPKRVCAAGKEAARRTGAEARGAVPVAKPHELMPWRRVPAMRLLRRLGLDQFVNEGPLRDAVRAPARVRIPLKQHAGVVAETVVKVGQKVSVGDLIAAVPEGELGARVHASISGTVAALNGAVTIEAG